MSGLLMLVLEVCHCHPAVLSRGVRSGGHHVLALKELLLVDVGELLVLVSVGGGLATVGVDPSGFRRGVGVERLSAVVELLVLEVLGCFGRLVLVGVAVG